MKLLLLTPSTPPRIEDWTSAHNAIGGTTDHIVLRGVRYRDCAVGLFSLDMPPPTAKHNDIASYLCDYLCDENVVLINHHSIRGNAALYVDNHDMDDTAWRFIQDSVHRKIMRSAIGNTIYDSSLDRTVRWGENSRRFFGDFRNPSTGKPMDDRVTDRPFYKYTHCLNTFVCSILNKQRSPLCSLPKETSVLCVERSFLNFQEDQFDDDDMDHFLKLESLYICLKSLSDLLQLYFDLTYDDVSFLGTFIDTARVFFLFATPPKQPKVHFMGRTTICMWDWQSIDFRLVSKIAFSTELSELGQHRKGCYVCLKSNLARRCSRCRTVIYCSTECQKNDFSFHKKMCHSLSRIHHEQMRIVLDESKEARAILSLQMKTVPDPIYVDRPGYVYIIYSPHRNQIKVGKSKTPFRRLRVFLTADSALHMIQSTYCTDMHALETYIHTILNPWRVTNNGPGREWFTCSPAIASFAIQHAHREMTQ